MVSKTIHCKKCGSVNVIKAGRITGNQRYRCKDCSCQFQPNRKKGRPESTKRLAILLYLSGLSMRTISKIVKTDLHAVYRWIRKFAENNYEKPEPTGDTVVVELDEMWHYIHNKKNDIGYGRLIVAIPVNLSTGSAEGETMIHFQNFMND
jgi:transposase-like protein